MIKPRERDMKSKILTGALAGMLSVIGLANAEEIKGEIMGKKNLVVYFSRTGEQYSVGNITEGNTAIVAKMIAEKTGADLFEVKLANDTYPSGYTELTEVAQQEKNNKARPEIIGEVENFADYDTVFIGSPVWWGDMPMALYSFIEKYDWSNKRVAPFTTHEGSGLGSIPENIKTATGANMLPGLAIYGHDAQNNRESTSEKVNSWLGK